ncbi:MAG TPA: ECF transporter S component [Eubacteriales bacterium]|nr:ECF transporter S component [Eubacteriales bacterium]
MSQSMTKTKRLVLAALCLALGVVLPIAFHSVANAGSIFLPMHIPVLLCGIICGWPYGLACGVLAPILSSLLTGMPPMAYVPSMVCELAVYGFASGLIKQFVKTGKPLLDIYIALISAMLLGRITFGVLNALIFKAGEYSLAVWTTAAFVTALPGIIIQIIIIPILVLALQKAKIIEA